MSVTTHKALDPWPIVKSGARFHPVASVQHLLNEHGHDLEVDASFGPLTEAAVRAAQRDFGLEADGVVGPLTWQAIVVTVRHGSRGHAVRGAQQELDTRDGFDVVVDGVFGPRTERAVRAFQSALSAFGVEVDGIAGPMTWRAMVSGMVSH
jgi:peptidoglycan hydrolase-like protein with peptidoglycan-binding domain